MTPEERLTRIENLLQAMTEHQVRHQQQLDEQIQTQIEKNTAGIRDLIVVSRTVLTSIQELREIHHRDHERVMAEIDKLREAQFATDEKLNILIDTVDRIIRRNGKERQQ